MRTKRSCGHKCVLTEMSCVAGKRAFEAMPDWLLLRVMLHLAHCYVCQAGKNGKFLKPLVATMEACDSVIRGRDPEWVGITRAFGPLVSTILKHGDTREYL